MRVRPTDWLQLIRICDSGAQFIRDVSRVSGTLIRSLMSSNRMVYDGYASADAGMSGQEKLAIDLALVAIIIIFV
jgi:hypothetical protein